MRPEHDPGAHIEPGHVLGGTAGDHAPELAQVSQRPPVASEAELEAGTGRAPAGKLGELVAGAPARGEEKRHGERGCREHSHAGSRASRARC